LDHVLAKAYQPEYGARPLRRYLEKHVTTNVSRMLISGELDSDALLVIDSTPPVDGDYDATQLRFKVKESLPTTSMDVDNGTSSTTFRDRRR